MYTLPLATVCTFQNKLVKWEPVFSEHIARGLQPFKNRRFHVASSATARGNRFMDGKTPVPIVVTTSQMLRPEKAFHDSLRPGNDSRSFQLACRFESNPRSHGSEQESKTGREET